MRRLFPVCPRSRIPHLALNKEDLALLRGPSGTEDLPLLPSGELRTWEGLPEGESRLRGEGTELLIQAAAPTITDPVRDGMGAASSDTS